MTPERVAEQRAEINWVNERLAPFRVLAGAEVEIRGDGSLDLPDEVLAEMDLVVASIHSGLRQEREKITQRLLAAIRNPHVDIIAHPTGRLLGQREEVALDFEAIVREAAKTGTILEINAQPNRLDLDGSHVKRAIQEGVLLCIGTDAHHAEGLDLMPLGVAMARRGWAEAKDIANTRSWEELRRKVKR
jgi:DNA polymerase (family 10)